MKKLTLIFAFCILHFLIGCSRKGEEIHKEQLPAVSVTQASMELLKEFIFYSGDIEAQDEATVYSKVPGKLMENKVQEADFVKKGQTLSLVDRDEVGYEFEPAPVNAPIEGIVGRTYLDKGANVTLQTPVALVVNIDEVLVKIDVTERDLPKLKEDLSAEIKIDAYPDEVFKGQVRKVSPVLDLDTRTAPVWINIANPKHRLKPGMFARIKLMVAEHKDVLVIRREAVTEVDSQRYVFMVEANRVHRRKVELGLASDGKYEVRKGLKLGDKVIIMYPPDLKDGDEIRIVEEIK